MTKYVISEAHTSTTDTAEATAMRSADAVTLKESKEPLSVVLCASSPYSRMNKQDGNRAGC